jgi:hypothetical protein
MPDKEIIALPENIVLVRCFDPDIDVALHAIKKTLKRAGCKRVREMPLTGGAVSFGRHIDFVDAQMRTLIDRGFTGIMLTVHTHCHHVKVNDLLPQNCDEHSFLKTLLIEGMKNIHEKFPEVATYSCIINTPEADSGVNSVKHFFSSRNHGVSFEFHTESTILTPAIA